MRYSPSERPRRRGVDCEDPGASYPWIMAAAILASSIAFIDGTIVSIALPAIRADLGASLPQMQWIVNAYTLTLAAFILPGGAAGDVFGRKQVFLAGVAIYTVTSLWAGLAGSVETLILARALEGFGGALMVPASLALITEYVPRERRGSAIGLWSAASAATTALGPILGGMLVDWAGWRPAVLLTVPFGALTLLVAWRGVPGGRGGHGTMDWTGGLLVCAGLGGVAIWLTNISAGAVRDGWVWGASGVVALCAFLVHQFRTAAPMMPLSLFRNGPFAAANVQTLLLYGALGGVLTYLPVVLIDARGFAASEAGLVLLPFALIIAALSRLAGRVLDRVGAKPLLVVGPAITAGGFAALGLVSVQGLPSMVVLVGMVLCGVGMGITVSPISTTVMNAVSEDKAGVASGVNNAVARAAGLIGVPVFGMVGQIGFTRRAPDRSGTFGEPQSVASGYAEAMLSGLVWVGVLGAVLALLSALTAWRGLAGGETTTPSTA